MGIVASVVRGDLDPVAAEPLGLSLYLLEKGATHAVATGVASNDHCRDATNSCVELDQPYDVQRA
jgi:hypothetical protein